MQNNFECIFKLIVALTFLMCVVCSHVMSMMVSFVLSFIPRGVLGEILNLLSQFLRVFFFLLFDTVAKYFISSML